MIAIMLILMLLVLLAFDWAAWRWGADSRDVEPRGSAER
jgi:hypothetical protein